MYLCAVGTDNRMKKASHRISIVIVQNNPDGAKRDITNTRRSGVKWIAAAVQCRRWTGALRAEPRMRYVPDSNYLTWELPSVGLRYSSQVREVGNKSRDGKRTSPNRQING